MKIHPFKIPKPENSALIYQEDIEAVFYDKLHQHNEIQLSFIEKGNGTLLVGNNISSYVENDIFIIGSNLPHAFKSDKHGVTESRMLSLFFTESSFGDTFFELSEFTELNRFFVKSTQGLIVKNNKSEIIECFKKLKKASKLERFILFIEILKHIAKAKSEILSRFVHEKSYSDIEGERMRNVFDYTIENAHKPIDLNTIASVANMTKNAFCKYFKKRTNKTYITFLNEIRVEHATRLLEQQIDLPIVEIAELSGFNNLSNFNRQFKKVKGYIPSYVRKRV
ncbi:AraC family transcriptional regulator [Algibacter sp. R77976]|uniref:AraC family transcriptional regulator n=1 Tax=Algibacter sp. R77976 TaxID=3093873 RepID=UPI0037C535A6